MRAPVLSVERVSPPPGVAGAAGLASSILAPGGTRVLVVDHDGSDQLGRWAGR